MLYTDAQMHVCLLQFGGSGSALSVGKGADADVTVDLDRDTANNINFVDVNSNANVSALCSTARLRGSSDAWLSCQGCVPT
jgi:hypothetical protein